MVDNRSRIGLLTKNHLLLMLLVLLDGRIPMDHDRSQFGKVPDKDGTKAHKELFEVLEHGLMVVVLGKAIWGNETPEDIKLIVDADNVDQYTYLLGRPRGNLVQQDPECHRGAVSG